LLVTTKAVQTLFGARPNRNNNQFPDELFG